ncbi:MAG: OmpA family protein [Proteobacteria bacterium]|nr:OmpA family protein [Pseudomonadota bacterium]MCH8220930.1 OmpA family protein [Pseudomonadota bacterium]
MSSRLSRISIMFLVAVLVAGCETINPYTGETQTSKATKGALIGAAAGAVVGLVTGDNAVERRQHALIGAGIGALAGAGIGYYMDVQEAKLRQKMAGTGVSVTRVGDNITLNMPGNITFETASSNLNGDFFRVLDGVSEVTKEFEKTLIEVAGHTDSRGSNDYNQRLSEQRADAVARYLESQGVMPLRIITVGLGEDMPVANNSTSEGQLLNRRVELTLVPITG